MTPLRPTEILNLYEYEKVREVRRAEIIALKNARRVQVGPYLTFVFENRVTVKFQIQEILRAERITDEALVREELSGFNTLLPGPDELSATLLIELLGSDPEVKEALARLTGLGSHLWLEVAGKRSRGFMEEGRDDGHRVAAVQYIRFPISDATALYRGPVALIVDHPAYSHRQELPDAVRKSLAQDLLPEAV